MNKKSLIERIADAKVGYFYPVNKAKVVFKDFYVTINNFKEVDCFSLGEMNGCPLPISNEKKEAIINMIEKRVVQVEEVLQDKADNLLIEF